LLSSGVKPGTRLALDSYVIDGSVAAVMGNAQSWRTEREKEPQGVERASVGQLGIGQEGRRLAARPVEEGEQGTGQVQGFPPRYEDTPAEAYRGGSPSGLPRGIGADPAFHAATTLVDSSSILALDSRNTSVPLRAVKKRSWTRRAFLSLGSTALVVGEQASAMLPIIPG